MMGNMDFTSFLIIFMSYQDDEWVITQGFEHWSPVYDKKKRSSPRAGLELETARSAGQRLTH